MSVICGAFARDGSPASPGWLQSMTGLFPAHVQGRVSQRLDGSVALARGIGLFTPQDTNDEGIIELNGGRILFCGFATLLNRQELIEALGLAGPETGARSDAWLTGQAYARWGENCAAHLAGIWAFAAWHREERRLTLIRDHSSYVEIFYHVSERHFAFGFRPRALMRLPFVPRAVNLDRVGQTLMVLRDDAVSSAWEGISLIPNGHRLKVDGSHFGVERYWRLEDAPAVRFGNDAAYVEAFRECFDRSVAGYLRSTGPLAATLSGGLDSALLVESSARQLRGHGKRLHAFTAVPAFDVSSLTPARQMGDEGEFAAGVAEQVGGIDHHLIEGGDISPVAGIARVVEQSDTLDYGVGNCFWLCNILDAASALSCKALLMGAAGNASVSWDGGSFVAHFNSWPPTPAAFARWHDRVGGSRLQAFRSLVLAPFVPRRVRAWRDGKGTSRYTSWQGYSSMNPDWFEEQGLAERVERSGRSLLFERPYHRDPRDEQLLTLRPDRRQGQGAWAHLTASSGVQARDPTADHRVIEFCLGVPSRQYQRDGVSRYLARRALDGRVPGQVVWNRRRGLQGADLALRIRRSAPEVRATLDRLEESAVARGMLDLRRMRRVLASAETTLDPALGLECELILMRGISAGLFLVGAEA